MTEKITENNIIGSVTYEQVLPENEGVEKWMLTLDVALDWFSGYVGQIYDVDGLDNYRLNGSYVLSGYEHNVGNAIQKLKLTRDIQT